MRDANPGVTLPHLIIAIVARLDASGTTYAFTEHLDAISSTWRQLGLGQSHADQLAGQTPCWPAATRASPARIKISEGAIGYVEYGFAKRLGLPMAALQNKAGKFVAPSASSGQVALASPTPPPLRDLPPPRSIPLRPAPIRSSPTAGSPSIGDTPTPPKAPRYANSSTGGCHADRTMASIWAMFRSRPVLFHSASRR